MDPTRTSHKVAATVLAAGLGRRLGGQPKAAIQVGHLSLLEHLVGALRGAGLGHIQVVMGPYTETLLPLAQRCAALPLRHEREQPSLIDSQRLALQAHRAQRPEHDLMLVLADLPWLTASHIEPLLQAWHARPEGVQAQMPVVGGVRGHPLILSSAAIATIAAMPDHFGVRDWMSAHPGKLCALPLSDAAYITDIDTPEDLAAFRAAQALLDQST